MNFDVYLPTTINIFQNGKDINGDFSLYYYPNHQQRPMTGVVNGKRVTLTIDYTIIKIVLNGIIYDDFSAIAGMYDIVVKDTVRRRDDFYLRKVY